MTDQTKQEIVWAQNLIDSAEDDRWNRYQRWWTTSSDGEQSGQTHTFPTVSLHSRKDERHDGVGVSFTRQILQTIKVEKVGTRRRQKRGNITVKNVIDPPKWADDDWPKRTMKTTTQDCVHFTAHSEAMWWQWCAFCYCICSPSWEIGSKAATCWVMTNQTDGSQNSVSTGSVGP